MLTQVSSKALQFRPSTLCTCLTIALAVSATEASAQQNNEQLAEDSVQTMDKVVVTAGRPDVVTKKEAIKAENMAIVDSITADSIARLPDATVAEALEAVPGVSSVPGFESSQARWVSLRGFDARYNSVSVDGNPIWNSSRNNRGTQIDVFPASVVHELNVFKTVTPDQDPNSIGGHIAIRTLRAFDGGTQAYFRGKAAIGSYDRSAPGPGDSRLPSYRLEKAGKFTFGTDNRFGAVFGVDLQRDSFYDLVNNIPDYLTLNGEDVPNGSVFDDAIFDRVTTRRALYGKLEVRATDSLYAFVSANLFKATEQNNWYRGGVFTSASNIVQTAPGAGTFTNVVSEKYLENYKLDRDTLMLSTGLDYRVGDSGVAVLRAGYTEYDHDEVTSRGNRFQRAGVSGEYRITNSDIDVTSLANPVAENPANWVLRRNRDAFDDYIPHRDKVYNVDASYGFNSHIDAEGFGAKAGLFWRRLDRNFNQTQILYRQRAGTPDVRLDQVLEDPDIMGEVTGPSFISNGTFWDLVRDPSLFTQTVDNRLTADYQLQEDVGAAHAAVTYQSQSVRVLVGARLERTDYVNHTFNATPDGPTPVTNRFRYSEFLPNVQFAWQFSPDWRLRLAYTETLARPDFGDFAFGQSISITNDDEGDITVVSGTNPFLDPRLGKSYDVSLERYFQNGGMAFLALFRKDLDNETFSQRRETRNEDGILTLVETIPLNSGQAKVDGVELGLSLDNLGEFVPALEGFGLDLNYTYLDGQWDVVFVDGSTRTVDGLRNMPRWLGNIVLSYGQGPFSINLGYRMRGRTFTGTFGATPDGDRWIDDYSRLDLQVGYQINDRLSWFAEARNLNKAVWKQQVGRNSDALRSASDPGRTFWTGVKFKF